jgi:hypothetical protein
MSTYVDGIGASQNIDSSGEIVDIAGLDISSLEYDGSLNWEHKKDVPDQLVGKILKAKKIFSDKDCEDDRQKYFWEKCKVPYLYILGELFDDYTDSARTVAGLFRYDSDRRGKNERDVIGFSVEGAQLPGAKSGMTITRSIARKITITNFPCNKQAFAEMVPSTAKKPKDSLDNIFKTESMVEIEIVKVENNPNILDLLKKEDIKKRVNNLTLKKDSMTANPGLSYGASNALGGGAPSSPSLACSESKPIKKALEAGSYNVAPNMLSGGAALGKENLVGTKKAENGGVKPPKPSKNYQPGPAPSTNPGTVRVQDTTPKPWFPKTGIKTTKSEVDIRGRDEASTGPQQVLGQGKLGAAVKQNGTSLSGNQNNTKLTNPTTIKPPNMNREHDGRDRMTDRSKPMHSVSAATQKSETIKKGAVTPQFGQKEHKIKNLQQEIDTAAYRPDPAQIDKKSSNRKPRPQLKKSQWLMRAEEDYNKWEKREQFESFMKSRMPHLTKSEVKAIGQTMLFNKSMRLEKSLDFQNLIPFKKK